MEAELITLDLPAAPSSDDNAKYNETLQSEQSKKQNRQNVGSFLASRHTWALPNRDIFIHNADQILE